MQVFEVGQERYAAITAVEVTVLYVGCLVDVEVAQWIELGGLLGILLGGIFAENFGYQTAFWSSVAFHIMGVAMFLFVTMTHYRKNALR